MASYKDLIVRYDQFEPTADSVNIGSANPNKSGQGKSARLQYNGRNLHIQTQKLRNPFGFSRGMKDTEQYGKKFSCTLSFDLQSPKGKAFRDSMVDLQNLVAKEAYENRVEWGLGKSVKVSRDMTEKQVRDMMTDIVRIPTNKDGEETTDYPPTFRVTFNTRNDPDTKEVIAITSEVYDQDGNKLEQVDETTIRPGSQCKVLMYASSVWITQGRFGVNFRIKQIKVYPDDGLPTGRCLIDDDDEEDEATDQVTEDTEGEEGDEESGGKKKLSLHRN